MAISQVSYSQNSPYYGTPLFSNGKFLDLLAYRAIPKIADDVLTPIPEHVYSFYYYFKLKNKMKFIYVKSSCRAHIHTHRCWLLVLGTLFF